MQIKNSFRRQIARKPGPSMTHHSNLYEFCPGAIVATVIYPEKGQAGGVLHCGAVGLDGDYSEAG